MSYFSPGPQETSSVDPEDLPASVPPPDEPDVEPKVLTSYAKLPVDHLLAHQPASKFCDVCRQAKLRARAHKRFGNQPESTREARVIESPTEFLQRICVDHMEPTEESLSGDSYALICVDKFSGVIGAYPAKSKGQAAVEQGLRHFCREKLPVVESDRYQSILAAVRDLKMHSDPSPPNDPIHNSHVESAINIVRQGTRSLLLQSGLHVGHWPSAMRCFGYQYNITTPPMIDSDSMRHAAHQYRHALPEGEGGPIAPMPQYESKLHMALQYQPEPRAIPYGALVWYLGKSREPTAPKTFGPNGRPALYIGPEILPGLRCKDIHALLDLQELTSHDHVREIRTRDFVPPAGPWAFPFSKIPMLQSLHVQPKIRTTEAVHSPIEVSDELLEDVPRNRSITKRRISQYGITDNCNGCINGTYSHTPECRARFNRLLDNSEPRGLASGGIDVDVAHGKLHDEPIQPATIDYEEDVPECPPRTPEELPIGNPHETELDPGEYTPGSLASTPESFWDDEVQGIVEGDLAELVAGGVGKAVKDVGKMGLLIEFCCSENSALCRVAEHLGVPYFGVTRESLNINDNDAFEQFLLWLQDEVQVREGPVHLWASLPCTKWSPWQRMAIHKHGKEHEQRLEEQRDISRDMVLKFKQAADLVKRSRGSSATFEWSRDSTGWDDPIVQQTMEALELSPVNVDGCA